MPAGQLAHPISQLTNTATLLTFTHHSDAFPICSLIKPPKTTPLFVHYGTFKLRLMQYAYGLNSLAQVCRWAGYSKD